MARSTTAVPDAGDGYTGRDNLEVMEEAENYNRWLCRVVASFAKKTDRILDFGAGSGTFAKVIAAEGYNLVCVEPDDPLRNGLAAAGLPAVASIDSIAPGSTDFVYCLNVLEHIENDHTQLARLAATLRPGGTLLIYVPAFEFLFSQMDEKVGHFRRYRRTPLARMVARTGLTVVHSRYVDTLGFLASLANKFFGSRDGSINPQAIRLFDRFVFPLSLLLDPLFNRVVGKNLLIVARKKS